MNEYKVEAMSLAVHAAHGDDWTAEDIVHAAKLFEAYLRGPSPAPAEFVTGAVVEPEYWVLNTPEPEEVVS